MACGLPVVVTAGGPTDEFCPDDACWRVRSTRRPVASSTIGGMQTVDAPWMLEPDRDDLVRVLQAVVADAAGRRDRGRAAARAARAFSWTAIAELYAERVRTLAARPTLADARADPMPLPDDPTLALLATPAWQGADALPALLAAWAAAADPASGACLCLLADPDVDGRAEAWEERILGAADAAGVDLERVADIAVLDASGDAETARRLHARCAGYVPLHDGCAGHVALAREAGSALLPPSADALRAFIDAALPGAARVP
jgi:hypothetical protein